MHELAEVKLMYLVRAVLGFLRAQSEGARHPVVVNARAW